MEELQAIQIIKNYLNRPLLTDEEIQNNYGYAISKIVEGLQDKNKNVASITQGQRSITYANDKTELITNDIKLLLPKPYVRLL